MTRAPAGFGEQYLKDLARKKASRRRHTLGRFKAVSSGWHARCQDCFAMVVIDKDMKLRDGSGIGGTATKKRCVRRSAC